MENTMAPKTAWWSNMLWRYAAFKRFQFMNLLLQVLCLIQTLAGTLALLGSLMVGQLARVGAKGLYPKSDPTCSLFSSRLMRAS